ncbi:MAG: OmpP1/FadL family transporter [Thiolinea sp.]
MHRRQQLLKPVCVALFAATGSVQAGGFGVTVQSGTGGGNAATGHAMAEDASAMYYNPALLASTTGRQLNGGAALLNTDIEMNNAGSTIPSLAAGFPVIGENKADPGGLSVTPSFFYRGADLPNNLVYGVGVSVPFGVTTEYDDDSFVRYEATESALKTLNINPAIAWKVNDQFDIGAGLNLQVGQATLARAIDSYLVCQRFVAAGQITTATCDALGLSTPSNVATDSAVSIEADAVGYGFNIGAAYRPGENTLVSLGLRSSVTLDFEGDADFSHSSNLAALGDAALTAAGLNDQDAETELEMPASASLAVAHQVNDKLTLHGDVTWTQWSSVPEIRIKFPETGAADSVSNLQWEDTVRVGAGLTYQLNDRMKLRAGIAHDPTPTPSPKNRTPRSPSSDNLWFSAGASYQLNKQMSLDAGLSLVHPQDTSVNYTAPGTSDYTTRATVESDVFVGAVSLNYRF